MGGGGANPCPQIKYVVFFKRENGVECFETSPQNIYIFLLLLTPSHSWKLYGEKNMQTISHVKIKDILSGYVCLGL